MLKIKMSYKPLFKQLIDRNMRKKDLCALAGISPATMTKMGKGGHVTTEVLSKICLTLDCGLADVLEIVTVGESENEESRLECNISQRQP